MRDQFKDAPPPEELQLWNVDVPSPGARRGLGSFRPARAATIPAPERRPSVGGDGGRGRSEIVLLLSIGEAARALGLGRSKTYDLIASGELETVHIGRAARVPVDAVEAFVARLRSRLDPMES